MHVPDVMLMFLQYDARANMVFDFATNGVVVARWCLISASYCFLDPAQPSDKVRRGGGGG